MNLTRRFTDNIIELRKGWIVGGDSSERADSQTLTGGLWNGFHWSLFFSFELENGMDFVSCKLDARAMLFERLAFLGNDLSRISRVDSVVSNLGESDFDQGVVCMEAHVRMCELLIHCRSPDIETIHEIVGHSTLLRHVAESTGFLIDAGRLVIEIDEEMLIRSRFKKMDSAGKSAEKSWIARILESVGF